MPSRTPTIEEQKDNLNIGLYLARNPHGVELDQILEQGLGYNNTTPSHHYRTFVTRFDRAQAVGRDKFKERVPGYFTFNAMPFGGIYVYKTMWYVWVNPNTGNAQTVPLFAGDLVPMQRFNDKYMTTRSATTRKIHAASWEQERIQAIQRGDSSTLRAIHEKMMEDGSTSEILTGLYGIPYADFEEVLLQLPDRSFGGKTLSFQQSAKAIKDLQKKLRQEQARVNEQLLNWVKVQTQLPHNAQILALQDAADRLQRLPTP
ncbi:MAG: hypothetical protein F4Y96_07080 [Chloroflexi bacterium]|nr:hypothetical protein [Chloroflexota bacterium]